MIFVTKFLFIAILITCVYGSTEAIDSGIHKAILDPEECHRQVRFIRSNSFLRIQFADAGIRIPRGIFTGNRIDLGNYHQCLGINHQLEGMDIQGKYCSILIPYDQNLEIPQPPFNLTMDEDDIDNQEFQLRHRMMLAMSGDLGVLNDKRTMPESVLSGSVFRVAVCVPRPCSTQQAIASLLFNITTVGFEYNEDFCRIPDDKPWVAADTWAAVIFSMIGILTILSTLYDVTVRFILKNDLKGVNPIHQSFSVYTNGQRLMNFSASSGNLQCLDGIRTIAIMWVIIGHTFGAELFIANSIDSFRWMLSAQGLWITAAPMSVDTFFTLSGILLVYTTAGRINGVTFLKNIHWFYLNRVVRILPLLATTVLLQASYFNRITDGPFWWNVVNYTNRCRRNWWSTLLYISNYVNPNDICLGHTWYVAIDVQLYLISPLVLYWVLTGNKRHAWTALFTGLFVILTASTTFNFIMNLQAGTLVLSRPGELADYMAKYYFNTLTRGSPFFVGMIYGYLLHICRGRKVQLSWIFVTFLWVCSAVTAGTILYCNYSIMQFNWDNQLIDNMINSFMRPMWGAALCWLIFACVHGYAGPMNWFLSLDIWRLPARLSYGMYLFHYPLMFVFEGAKVAPVYFSVAGITFKYLSHQVLALALSFVLTLLIAAPISFLFKRLMDTVHRKRKTEASDNVGKEEDDLRIDTRGVQNDEHKTQ